jgi:mRNA interferase MazF
MAKQAPHQFEIYLVNLDPTIGKEMKKTRPCVVVSPNSINRIGTAVIAPLTSSIRENMPWRVNTVLNKKHGQIATDQIKTVDHVRLVRKLAKLPRDKSIELSEKLVEMFSL